MAGRFTNPFPQFFNSTPTVLSGAKLFTYAAGTSTKLTTYSDRTLSTPNTNPILLNSSGYPSSEIFLQDLDYKIVLAPATDSDPPTSAIWTCDYINARDSKLIAKTVAGTGSPNGTTAGTAGSASILPDFYWDYTNNIFYVCTTTGTTLTAVWTALNVASTASVPPPQGRLTLTSGAPVLAAEVAAATAVYYAPYTGNLVPIYNGTTFAPTEFAELTLTLAASHTAGSFYDVFAFSNSGVVTLATGPSWSTLTAGSGARGTGGGTTQLARVKGLWTNAVSMTGRNGATTYTISANLGTYLGSIQMDGTNGQLTCHMSWGQSRKFGVWNAYNRVPIILKAGDSTATWTYNTNTIRASRADATNKITTFVGLPECYYDLHFMQKLSAQSNAGIAFEAQIGIGINSTTAYTGTAGYFKFDNTTASGMTDYSTIVAAYRGAPITIGINDAQCLERTVQAGTTNTYSGAEAFMMLSSRHEG